eukprot:3369287-Rhodomonas_salina.1
MALGHGSNKRLNTGWNILCWLGDSILGSFLEKIFLARVNLCGLFSHRAVVMAERPCAEWPRRRSSKLFIGWPSGPFRQRGFALAAVRRT